MRKRFQVWEEITGRNLLFPHPRPIPLKRATKPSALLRHSCHP